MVFSLDAYLIHMLVLIFFLDLCQIIANGQGRPPDWEDFVGIILLLAINATLSFIEENNAGKAAAALMAQLSLKTKVLRDGSWSEQDAEVLVPGKYRGSVFVQKL